MPEYRKLHNNFDMGERTAKLTDFEFRVWCVYRASSDDFGVCPFLAGTLKGRSRRLSQKPVTDKLVLGAMQRLVEIGLCLDFEHQGLRYLCQVDWQDREDIRHPRTTGCNPAPPPHVFGNLSEITQEFFRRFHPKLRPPARAGGRETQTLTETQTETVPPEESRETKPRRVESLVPRGVAARWGEQHGDHLTGFCDWMCFPETLVNQFAARLSERDHITHVDATREVERWARSVRASGVMPTGKMFDFWNGQWQATHGSSAPVQDGAAGRQARSVQRVSRFVEHG